MNEENRLAAVAATGLLDSEPDPRFDRVTRLAANSLEAEVALVTLVDHDRQWFKSGFGYDGKETPRSIAFCDYAIRKSEVMVVLDATKDPRFVDNPLVTGEPFVRFYAGAPLITSDGHTLGTLCVLDTKPRKTFDETDKQILRDLAESIMLLIRTDDQKRDMVDMNVINRELQHRMGNMYAHVSSLISLLDKSELEHEEFVVRLREKIQALSIAQSLIAANKRQVVSIRTLAIETLKGFEGGAGEPVISVQEADDFEITPRAAFAMSLLLHELGTNSIKHGALGSDGGRAAFNWTQGPDMRFSWRETLVQPRAVAAMERKGFGTVILNRIVPKTFGGKASLDVLPDGFSYSVSAIPEHVLVS